MIWGYSLGYWMLAFAWLGIAHGGAFVWTGFCLGFFVVPALELFFPWRVRTLERKTWFSDVLVWLAFPIMTMFLLYTAKAAGSLKSSFELLGASLSAGTLAGILAINVGHELVHRRDRWQRALGVGLLSLVNYAHYGILHVYGHHKNVATPGDPATARFGESLYVFLLRHYSCGLKEAYLFEARRVQAKGRPWLLNRVVLYWIAHFGAMAGLYYSLGAPALVFWLGQSVVAVCLLMDVDYIEHYGLLRGHGPDGQYLAVRAEHSWDSDSAWTNLILFNLGLHSHHHLRANLEYPDLRPQDQARKMPYGYFVLLLTAFVPPLYHALIHPRLGAGLVNTPSDS